MSQFQSFGSRMLADEMLCGTFVKTPAHEVVEVLAKSGLDFVTLDAEHSPFDRGRLDACLAIARALDFLTRVRMPTGSADEILKVPDSGALSVILEQSGTEPVATDIHALAD